MVIVLLERKKEKRKEKASQLAHKPGERRKKSPEGRLRNYHNNG